MKQLILPLLLFMLVGCASPSTQKDAEKPPPKAARVELVVYDPTPRQKTSRLDVYDKAPPQRPYKVIALLTCEGAVDQEAVMTTAILYRARQLGADGVMTAEAQGYKEVDVVIGRPGWRFGRSDNNRCIFRARAIVYEDK